MKLHFFNDNKNFGDQLNHWLWNQFFANELRADDEYCLVGVGTILDHKIPVESHKLVLGSGTGYARCAEIDDKWDFLAVRGPLTAAQLGLDNSIAITDSAALLSMLDVPGGGSRKREGGVLFVPHISSLELYDWKGLCLSCGIEFLDPTSDVDLVLQRIHGAELVIAEAMHAAIIADTYRVPWIPVVIYPHINEFKWADWCLSLGMNYHPVRLPSLYNSFSDERKTLGRWSDGGWMSRKIKNFPEHVKVGVLKALFAKRISTNVDHFHLIVNRIRNGYGVMLSENNVFESRVASLYEKVSLVRKIVAS